MATAEPSDIVKHLQQSSGGVNTIVDRIKHRTALHYAYVSKIEKIENGVKFCHLYLDCNYRQKFIFYKLHFSLINMSFSVNHSFQKYNPNHCTLNHFLKL